VKYQLFLVSFVITVVHRCHWGWWFLGGGWRLGVDFLIPLGLGQLFTQVLGQLLVLLGLLFCGLGWG
jgi:hypothetical protein